ncbi:MAG: CDP-glycerol glycerophosphotransferase family protein [Proteobacteria bacterium]|nr:CDP-glycerol glycerophosphotransferase family protein [Pseudomonadota bacterium]
MNTWGRLAARDPHVHLIADPAMDIAPYLLSADVLVSDASGVIFQYLALDRPIVLITNPERAKDTAHYDAEAIEWRWRDVGEEITNVADLAAAVDRALADPGKRAGKRAEYRKLLFDDLTDGGAVRRIVEEVSGL